MIEQLKRLSPVPIEFKDEMSILDFSGIYYSTDGFTGKTAYIEVSNNLDNDQKIAVLVHEIGHATCDVKGCKCMKNPDHTEREIHANKFTLKWLLKHKQKEALSGEINCITKQANGFSSRSYYITAARHIMGLKLWQKCLNYINESES